MLPLSGLKVMDFSHAADGPMCGYMLASAGADVIKIEPLEGDPYRQGFASTTFFNGNRNKRGLALNLQREEGRKIALRLAANADIILESFTPGTAGSLGIDYDTIERINPRIIYCSLSGFGQTGPYSRRPAYDPVIQAMSGFMMTTGEEGRPPVRVGPGVIGLGTAFIAAYGILLAVIQREKTGRGQYIDAAFFDTAVFFLNAFLTSYSILGIVPPRMGSANPAFVPYQCFETSDRYVFIGVTQERFWQGFCRALEQPELENDPRFINNQQRLEHRKELLDTLAPVIKSFDSTTLLSRLEAAGVPCAPVNNISEVINNPQVTARKMLNRIEYPDAGGMLVAALPLKMSNCKFAEDVRPPLAGEHTAGILRETGFTDAEIDALRRKGVILNKPM